MIMKKIVIILAMAAFLFGCDKEFSGDNPNDDVFTVNLTFTGEVSVTEEPLTKSISSDDLVGIQVYQNDEPYAYGLFDDAGKMSINLHTGKKYTFKSQLIKNGKSVVTRLNMSSGDPCYHQAGRSYKSDYWTSYEIYPNMRHLGSVVYYFIPYSEGYCEPFAFSAESMSTGYSTYKKVRFETTSDIYYKFTGWLPNEATPVIDLTNSFIYDSTKAMNITNSYIMTENQLTVDRYYGEARLSSASRDGQPISIEMKHLVYGIQCNVTGVTDGTASITIKNGDNTLLEKSDISGEYHSGKMFFAFSDMQSAWQYADDYTENVTVSMTWLRGVGVSQDLGSQVIQVKRNCVNVVTVSLSTTRAGSASSVEFASEN